MKLFRLETRSADSCKMLLKQNQQLLDFAFFLAYVRFDQTALQLPISQRTTLWVVRVGVGLRMKRKCCDVHEWLYLLHHNKHVLERVGGIALNLMSMTHGLTYCFNLVVLMSGWYRQFPNIVSKAVSVSTSDGKKSSIFSSSKVMLSGVPNCAIVPNIARR